jgi:transketolase
MQLHHKPAVLILSRQALPTLDRKRFAPASGVAKGGYVLADAPGGKPDILFLATGSEVPLAIEAYEKLSAKGVKARVVSMPSWELFEQQPEEYRDRVIPPEVTARISVEQGSTLGWALYLGSSGRAIGMKTFGASAPLKELQRKFGFTPESLLDAAEQLLSRK